MNIEKAGFRFSHEPLTILPANDQWRWSREPVLRPMPDGSLVCWILAGGHREGDKSNLALITRSRDRGETWTPPEVLFSHGCRAMVNTEIFTEGKVPFGFVETFDGVSQFLEIRTAITYTYDNGVTWTEPVAPRGIPANVNVRQGIALSDGTWVFPVYWEECREGWSWGPSAKPDVIRQVYLTQPDRVLELTRLDHQAWPFCCGCIRSVDEGNTFSLHGYLARDGISLWEPTIVETTRGLLMLIRAQGTGVLYRSVSRDGGLTWPEAQPTDIPNPGTKSTLLKQGQRVLLLHNPTDCETGRKRIELWGSDDQGETWPTRLPLVEAMASHTKEHGRRRVCYPHAFLADEEELLYVAVDAKTEHYLLKIPYDDFSY